MKTITKTLVLVTGLGVGLAATGVLLAHGPSGYMGGPGMMNGGYGYPGMMQQGYGNGTPMGPGMMGRPGMMGGPGMMQGGTMGPGMMGQWGTNPAEKLSAAKTELGITPDQEAAWDNYATALQAHIALGQASHQAMWAQRGGMQGPSGNNFHQAMWESRQKLSGALQGLRSALSPAQQQRAQSLLGPGCTG